MEGKELGRKERKEMNSHYNTFHMYCENDVIMRLRRFREKPAYKRLMFKYDGHMYAIFSFDVEKRTKITDYTLTLEEVEEFAEKYRD